MICRFSQNKRLPKPEVVLVDLSNFSTLKKEDVRAPIVKMSLLKSVISKLLAKRQN